MQPWVSASAPQECASACTVQAASCANERSMPSARGLAALMGAVSDASVLAGEALHMPLAQTHLRMGAALAGDATTSSIASSTIILDAAIVAGRDRCSIWGVKTRWWWLGGWMEQRTLRRYGSVDRRTQRRREDRALGSRAQEASWPAARVLCIAGAPSAYISRTPSMADASDQQLCRILEP